MNDERKARITDKLAAAKFVTGIGGKMVKDPVKATEAVRAYLLKNPGATVAEATKHFAGKGAKPGIGGKMGPAFK